MFLNLFEKLNEKYKFEDENPSNLSTYGWITPDNRFIPRTNDKNHVTLLRSYYKDTTSSGEELYKRAAEDGFIRLMGYAVDLPDLTRSNLRKLARFLEIVVSPKVLHDPEEYMGYYAILNNANNRVYMDVPFEAIDSGDIRVYFDPKGSRVLV